MDKRKHILNICDRLSLSNIFDTKNQYLRTAKHQLNGYRFCGCIERLNPDNFSLYVELSSSDPDLLKWPVEIHCEVFIINDSTDASFALGSADVIYHKDDFQNVKPELANVKKDSIKAFIDENNIVLNWRINLKSSPEDDECVKSGIDAPVVQKMLHNDIPQFTHLDNEFISDETLTEVNEVQSNIKHCSNIISKNKEQINHMTCNFSVIHEKMDAYVTEFTETLKLIQEVVQNEEEIIDNHPIICHNTKGTRNEDLIFQSTSFKSVCSDQDVRKVSSELRQETVTKADTKEVVTNIKSNDGIDILLVGNTGHGKSTLGNFILQRNEFATTCDRNFTTFATKMSSSSFKGRIIKVIDTPALSNILNDYQEDTDRFIEEISKAMAINPEGFHAIIYVIKFGTPLTRDDVNAISLLENILGKYVMRHHGILVFTGGDIFELENEVSDGTLTFDMWLDRQIEPSINTLIRECGTRIMLFNNKCKDKRSKDNQIARLIEMIDDLVKDYERYTNEEFQIVRKERMYNQKSLKVKKGTKRQVDKYSVKGWQCEKTRRTHDYLI